MTAALLLGMLAGLATVLRLRRLLLLCLLGLGVVMAARSSKSKIDDSVETSEPRSPAVYLAEANASMADSEYDAARRRAMAALAAGADRASCLRLCAECSFYLRDDERATGEATELLFLPGGDGRGRLLRGLIKLRAGDLATARDEFECGSRGGDARCARELAKLVK